MLASALGGALMTTEEHREPLSSEVKHLEGEVGTHAHHPLLHLPVFEQLKQRNVFRVAVLYLVVCWLILDPVHVVFHMLEVPAWANRLVVMLMAVGFPAVVIFAWVYEITPEGLKPTVEVPQRESIRKLTGRRLDRAIIAVLAVALAYFVVDKFWISRNLERSAPVAPPVSATSARTGSVFTFAPPAASIAVLAFTDLSAEGNQGYFSDGIAEEILNVLAHVEGLKVASRTSSFQFRKSELSLPAIAQRLGVRHILEGSVRKAGDTVRISAQLIDATTDQHLWTQNFDRPLTTANLFAIQDEIASAIVAQLTATMGGTMSVGKPIAVKAGTADLDVYDLYLKGRSLFIARTKDNLSQAARVLRTALAKDPKFARAWETLGAVLVVSEYWGLREERDYQQGALDAADQALRLDPSLSLANAVRGRAQYNMLSRGSKSSWDESLANLAQAIDHDPQNATAFLWRGGDYLLLGFLERAREDLQHCLDIDPAYEICRRFLAVTYLALGRTDDAMRSYEVGMTRAYRNLDAFFAPAAAARGERLGVLGMLAQQFDAQPQLIQPIFRALTDSKFNDRDRQEGLALVDRGNDDADSTLAALWILRSYDEMSAVSGDTPSVIWLGGDPAWLKAAGRKKMMLRWRLPEYWRLHGFPPQCRPIGEANFECR
jgi:adenylate cyclase